MFYARVVFISLVLSLAFGCGDKSGGGSDAGAAGAAAGAGAEAGSFSAADGGAGLGAGTGAADPGTPTPSGGTLQDGVCTPAEGPTRESLGDKVKVLDSRNGILFGPELHATGAYYSFDRIGLYRIPAGSDAPELIAETPDERFTPWIVEDYLYYRVSGAGDTNPIERIPLDDLKQAPEMVGVEPSGSYTVAGKHLYVADWEAKEIYRVPFGSDTKQVLATEVSAEALAVNGDHLYFARSTGGDDVIARIPLEGGTPETFLDASTFEFGIFFDVYTLSFRDGGLVIKAGRGWHFATLDKPTEHVYLLPSTHRLLKVTADRVYWEGPGLGNAAVGWTARDNSDCKIILQGDYRYNDAVIGDDVAYITTFAASDNDLYTVPLD
jgi:hypothetical protein